MDKGLVIIGVHTPEFQFEQNYDNVLAAVQKFVIYWMGSAFLSQSKTKKKIGV